LGRLGLSHQLGQLVLEVLLNRLNPLDLWGQLDL
jgi:hypothetical protein